LDPGAPVIFYVGGARSGKSRLAQARAESLPGEPVYLATAQALDTEMHQRIARHRADRDPRWRTVEVPLALPQALRTHDGAGRILLVDCLTLWLSNLMLAGHDLPAARCALIEALACAEATLILVANEVGLGIVPDNALARAFRDEAGHLNQAVAAAADEVDFVAAGLALVMKPATAGRPVPRADPGTF